jgi:EamA domain-containing membrane protein RarD
MERFQERIIFLSLGYYITEMISVLHGVSNSKEKRERDEKTEVYHFPEKYIL